MKDKKRLGMKQAFLFVAIAIVAGAVISGCVSANTLAFTPKASNEIPASAAKERSPRREGYIDCLLVKATESVVKQGSYTRAEVKATCAPLGQRYYDAVFATAYRKEQRADFSANTAREAVGQLERMTFDGFDKQIRR